MSTKKETQPKPNKHPLSPNPICQDTVCHNTLCHNITSLDITCIDWQNSPYNFLNEVTYQSSQTMDPTLDKSIQEIGLITPIIVDPTKTKKVHLVDGLKRLKIAQNNGWTHIPAIVLNENIPNPVRYQLCYEQHKDVIHHSVITKLQFSEKSILFDISKPILIQTWYPILEIHPHATITRDCTRILALPDTVQQFCHEKQLSFKQCLVLTYYPDTLIPSLLALKETLPLSLSVILEVADSIKDTVKRTQQSVSIYLDHIHQICNAQNKGTPAQQVSKIRDWAHRQKNPILTGVNDIIQKEVSALSKHYKFDLDWDKTLENKRLKVQLQIETESDWTQLQDQLQDPTVKSDILSILDKL